MPTRRCPPAESAANITGSVRASDPGRRPRRPARQRRNRGHQRLDRARHPPGHPHDQVAMDLTAVRRAMGVEQPVHRRHVADVEQFELRDDLADLCLLVELDHERPRVHEDVVAEVDGPAGQRAGVGLGLEDPQPGRVAVVHRAAGRQLNDQRRLLADGLDGVGQPGQIQGRLGLGVPDVDVDHGRAGRLAGLGGTHQLIEGDRQREGRRTFRSLRRSAQR